ncbi:peptidoglycan-binding domain-containing protein [Marinicauda pacifica]|uniref:peptidoglycan-binding domain-containing protein n=1 Tax=Marinicauda pacifica TaxID=1133559 RepID=UPI0035C7CCB7
MVRTSDGRNRLRCDLGSRSRECVGASSSRAAASSAARFSAHVFELQTALMRHCAHLPSDFADGISGAETQQALLRFQRAYGLQVDGLQGPETTAALARSPNGLC